jgi:hypothetical protein
MYQKSLAKETRVEQWRVACSETEESQLLGSLQNPLSQLLEKIGPRYLQSNQISVSPHIDHVLPEAVLIVLQYYHSPGAQS